MLKIINEDSVGSVGLEKGGVFMNSIIREGFLE